MDFSDVNNVPTSLIKDLWTIVNGNTNNLKIC